MLNAAMFSCSYVRFCFQVFLGFEISFFLIFFLDCNILSQGARNPHSPVLANEDQVMWGCKRTC